MYWASRLDQILRENRGAGQIKAIAMPPMRDGLAGDEWSYRLVRFDGPSPLGRPPRPFPLLGILVSENDEEENYRRWGVLHLNERNPIESVHRKGKV